MIKRPRAVAQELLGLAGVKINGKKPWDIQVHDSRFFVRVFRSGSLGLGESYMDGWWDCSRLDEFFYRVLRYRLDEKVKMNWPLLWRAALAKVFNNEAESRAFVIGERHYDKGNDLFEAMLGKTMAYSCGYWLKARNLDQAQQAKFDLICRKLGLKPGMTILDIGSGWGTFMKYAAQKYKVKTVGITVSKEQAELGKKLCRGLPIQIKLTDWRGLEGKFDRVVSVGMFEHVGHKNYRAFFQKVSRCLKDDGLFLLHTIANHKSKGVTDPWTAKYIFPTGHLPSIKLLGAAIEKFFVVEDWHNFGSDYDKTLVAWHQNFERSWPKLEKKYGQRFYRMWRYYLLSCAGLFRARRAQLWQIVLSKHGLLGGWRPVR
ncbi:MAG: cyclopropane-fatty-acyl-phospholipid synthase [Parcubacteria group bacterium Gr01-1014_30]|nr:MAG: cyclopropane-fatty-acyl-phospholipid synthase [Parcubacteria group bacterium Gr01-1014_30]